SRHHGLSFGAFLIPTNHAVWIDVPGIERKEGTSYYNEDEIDAIVDTLRAIRASEGWENFVASERTVKEIGVISFYGSQTSRLRDRLTGELDLRELQCRVRPVDKFQGMERDIVIVSLVRSSRREEETGGRKRNYGIGFAKDYRRINVAFSRARRLLVIVGDRQHFCRQDDTEASGYYRRIWDTISNRGATRTCEQLVAALERGGMA
ncbi:MAG: hypothetical protein JNG85_16210, partial [Spirochaetaceae bacterium]|nr:hypothetical protein [Spirochaetaceae bacterium]